MLGYEGNGRIGCDRFLSDLREPVTRDRGIRDNDHLGIVLPQELLSQRPRQDRGGTTRSIRGLENRRANPR